MAAALAVIAELGPDLGLELNLVKNEAVFFWDDTPDPFPKEVERFRDGFELLGSPIGDAAFCRKHIGKFTAKAVAHTLGPLSSLEDPQVVHMLLRLCASFCRVVHLLRAVPTPYAREAIAEFDSAVQKALHACSTAWACFLTSRRCYSCGSPWHWAGLACGAQPSTLQGPTWHL